MVDTLNSSAESIAVQQKKEDIAAERTTKGETAEKQNFRREMAANYLKYFFCPSELTILHLKKLLQNKHQLDDRIPVN